MALVSGFSASCSATLSNALDFATASFPLGLSKSVSYANGTAANQADVLWSDQRTVTTGATDSLDLTGGGLTNAFGAAVAFAKIRGIYVASAAANTTVISLTRPASGVPWVSVAANIAIQPGCFICMAWSATAGVAVTGGSGDLIDIVNAAGASATYDIVIVGTSA